MSPIRHQPTSESERLPEGNLQLFGYGVREKDEPYCAYLTPADSNDKSGFEFDLTRGAITQVIEDVMTDRFARSSREFGQTISGDLSSLKEILETAKKIALEKKISFDTAVQEAHGNWSRSKIHKIIREGDSVH